MRIALFCPSYGEVGGIETKVASLTDRFHADGHDVAVLARERPGALPASNGVAVRRVPFHQLPRRARHVARELRFLRDLPGALAQLRRAAAAWRPDVVISLAITSYAPYSVALGRVAPVLLGLESGGPSLTTRPWIMRWALRRAARVVAVATSVARAAAAVAPDIGPRLTVIPNGVDPSRFSGSISFAHPRPYVLAVARLSREKGIDLLLDAFARLEAAHAGVDLLIAGDGPERTALLDQRARLRLTERVHLLGNVGPDGIPPLYRGALLVALPSRWEGLPLVALEAMASARAVVATEVDGVPDAVHDDETGMLVPPEDPAALADALARLIADPDARQRLGDRGRAVAQARFTWPVIAARYLELAGEVAAERRAGQST